MGNGFEENSRHNVDKKKYDEGYAKIFGENKKLKEENKRLKDALLSSVENREMESNNVNRKSN